MSRSPLALLTSFGLLAPLALLTACVTPPLSAVPGDAPATRVNAVIQVSSDDPGDPLTVRFGEVEAGSVRDAPLTIRNVGTDTLALYDLVLSDPSFELLGLDAVQTLLVPDERITLTLRYRPAQDESVAGTLLIESNDRETPAVLVSLRAEGLAPSVALDPPSFDFGNRELGCAGSLPLAVRNVGRAPLRIDAIAFEDLAGNGELALSTPPDLSLPLVLAPGAPPLELTIQYSPTDVQLDSGVLTVSSNDPLRPEASAEQFGLAHLGDNQLDEFAQSGNNATDVLFVVDNSGSMGDEQGYLAANFTGFAQVITALDIDYQVGVVSTDLGDNGVLQGTTPIVTPNTPDPSGTFASNVNLGTGGSGSERAFDSAYLALSSPNIDPGGPNQGFLRDDAGLRIVVVTDEPNQSTLLGTDPFAYVSWFQGLKVNPEHVVLSDIAGGLTGCTGAGGNASPGVDFMATTASTGGISASICDPNWLSTLSALGWLSQSAADTFELSETPVPDTVEVRLSNDGLNFVPIYVGWTYDAALNAVVFDLDALPDNGDFVQIGYAVLGSCEG